MLWASAFKVKGNEGAGGADGVCGEAIEARASKASVEKTVRISNIVKRKAGKENWILGRMAFGHFEDFGNGVPVTSGGGSLQDFIEPRPRQFRLSGTVGKAKKKFQADEKELPPPAAGRRPGG